MPRTPEQLQKLVADGWDLYEKIPRVTETVDLYAAAFAFGGLDARRRDGRQSKQMTITASEEWLEGVGRELFIAGVSNIGVGIEGSNVQLADGRDLQTTVQFIGAHDRDSEPKGFLWVTAQNDDAIMLMLNPRVLQAQGQAGQRSMASILDHVILDMLPAWVLDPSRFNVTGAQIGDALVSFIFRAEQIRESFTRDLSDYLETRLDADVDVEWAVPLRPNVSRMGGIFDLGNIYRVFLRCGVDLEPLRAQATQLATEWANSQLIPMSEAAAIARSFQP